MNNAKKKELNYPFLSATEEVLKDYQTGRAAPCSSCWTKTVSSVRYSLDIVSNEPGKR